MKRALFLDRDGIFNEVIREGELLRSPTRWEDVHIYPGLERLSKIKRLGFLLVMITNQPDIERGRVPVAFAEALHKYYQETYGLDAVYMCPSADESHPDKKPNPGMFLRAAKDLGISLKDSFHLGDTIKDVEGARRAGCKSIVWDRDYNRHLGADYRVSSIEEVIACLKA